MMVEVCMICRVPVSGTGVRLLDNLHSRSYAVSCCHDKTIPNVIKHRRETESEYVVHATRKLQ